MTIGELKVEIRPGHGKKVQPGTHRTYILSHPISEDSGEANNCPDEAQRIVYNKEVKPFYNPVTERVLKRLLESKDVYLARVTWGGGVEVTIQGNNRPSVVRKLARLDDHVLTVVKEFLDPRKIVVEHVGQPL